MSTNGEICALSAKGSAAEYLSKQTEFPGFTAMSWLTLLGIVVCGAAYLFAAIDIKRTNLDQLNFEAGIMWVGLTLNFILLLNYFIYCNDFFIMLSQAVQQILIIIFCWLMTL